MLTELFLYKFFSSVKSFLILENLRKIYGKMHHNIEKVLFNRTNTYVYKVTNQNCGSGLRLARSGSGPFEKEMDPVTEQDIKN